MYFKKISALFLATQLVVTQAAAATLTDLRADITTDYKSVEITAQINTSDSKVVDEVLIKILNPGYEDSDVEAALLDPEKEPILAVDTIDVESSSTLYKKIGLRSDLEDGRYYIYLSGSNLTEPERQELWFVKDIQSYVDQITSQTTINDMQKKLFENSKRYDADPDNLTYDLADVISLKNVYYTENSFDETIAKIILAEKAAITDWSSLKKVFKIATVMGAFEKGRIDVLTGEDGLFKETIFDASTKADMAEAEVLFRDELNSNGRRNTLDALKDEEWSNIAAFEKEFAAQLLYDAVFHNIKEGHGHIPALIEKYDKWNSLIKNYDYSAFSGLSDAEQLTAASLLINSGATNPTEMHSKLMKIINPDDEGSNSGSNGSGNGGGSGRGGSNSYAVSNDYISNLEEISNKREQEWLAGFSDMKDYSWAAQAVSYLTGKGIVSGTGNNTFSPDRSITREEFAKLLVLTMGYQLTNGKENFDDVDVNAWYAPYVATLREKQITEGSGDNKFNVGAKITREEACTLIYRAAAEKLSDGEERTFVDAYNITDYARDAVTALSKAGIITGNESGSFLPKNNMTRAEAAVVFYRILAKGGNTQ